MATTPKDLHVKSKIRQNNIEDRMDRMEKYQSGNERDYNKYGRRNLIFKSVKIGIIGITGLIRSLFKLEFS